ncbi:MAG TPA: murein biosynthesis integral membrane protein MurJ [Patescibacteria group bacterium]|nr:murein biosynthesis integral membrane protein MurJ [Patescibacteria group bacterium]
MQKVIDKISQVGSNAIIIAAASLASRLLGIFRDRVLASEFGAGQTLDTYYSAFRIPDLIFNLLILGALSSAFIPVFSKLFFKDEKAAWKMVGNFINVVLSVLVVAMIVVFIFAPWLMKLISPGFNTVQLEDVTMLTRIMLLSPLFFAVSSIIGGVLNSLGRFFVYSLAPILYNIGIIIGALYLVPLWGISGLAWGVVFGAMAHMLVQTPTFFKAGFRIQKVFDYKEKYLLRIIKLMLPVTIGLAVVQINLLVDNIIGSTLENGSIAIINLATNIISMPVGLVGISFAVSVFPVLSYAYSQKKEDVFVENFVSTFKMILFLIIPSMIFAIIFRAHIVRILLGAGLFNVSNTIWTSRTLGYMAFGLVAQALIPFLTRAFYASGDTKTPVKIVFISVLVNVVASIFFTKVLDYKVVGLALSATIAAFVNVFFLLGLLTKKFHHIDFNRLFMATGEYLAFSIIAGLASYGTLYFIEPYFYTIRTIGLIGQTAIAVFVGVFVYLLLSTIFKSKEAQKFTDSFAGIFRRLSGIGKELG